MARIIKTTILLTVIIFLSKFFGFFREIALANVYGATYKIDAYIAALSIPNILLVMISEAITTTYIPIAVEINKKGRNINKFTNNLMNFALLFSSIIFIVGVFYPQALVELVAGGFEGETLALTVRLVRIVIIVTFSMIINKILDAYHQSQGSFLIPAFRGLILNIIMIAVILGLNSFDIQGVVAAYVVAMTSMSVYLYFFARKKGYRYKAILEKDDALKKVFFLAIPILIGSTVGQINVLVDRWLASGLAEGSIAALNYAHILINFVLSVFLVPIVTVIYPKISMLAQENLTKFKHLLLKAINYSILILLPILTGTLILNKEIIVIIFKRGAFDNRAVEMTSIALFFYALGIMARGLNNLFVKAFYSMQDTKTPIKIGIFTVFINILLNLILVRYMAHAGLALATSIAACVSTVLLFSKLRKKTGSINGGRILKAAVKCGGASILMAAIVSFTKAYISGDRLLGFIALITVGASSYITACFAMQVEEVRDLVTEIQAYLKRKKN